jgi:hypothetical protein
LSVTAAAGGEDVEVEAVLVDAARAGERAKAGDLRTVACVIRCIQRAPPALDRLRRLPAKFSDGGRSIGNAKKGVDTILSGESTDRPFNGADD